MYGPTETTVSATIAELHAHGPVTIGQALPGYILSVLDERTMEPVPPGHEGELCIGGQGVALGYLNLPTKTAQSRQMHASHVLYCAPWRRSQTGSLAAARAPGGHRYISRPGGALPTWPTQFAQRVLTASEKTSRTSRNERAQTRDDQSPA